MLPLCYTAPVAPQPNLSLLTKVDKLEFLKQCFSEIKYRATKSRRLKRELNKQSPIQNRGDFCKRGMTTQYDDDDDDDDDADIGKEHPRPSTNKVIDALRRKKRGLRFFFFSIDIDEEKKEKEKR